MKSEPFENSGNKSDQTPEWYEQTGRGPFQEDGFTATLMARIELAADSRAATDRRFFSRKSFSLGLSAFLLFGVLVWPLGSLGKGNYAGQLASLFGKTTAAAVQPSALPSPSAAAKEYNPPVGSAEFELGGQKYYMPLPFSGDKSYARAVETDAGIVWSPPPPVVNYTKPKLTHNTEPYSLYLTPKGHSELSVASAKRIYTFPLYAGGAQTYNVLAGIYGGGNYVLLITNTKTIGSTQYNLNPKLSIVDLTKAESGELSIPKEIMTLSSEFAVYRSYIAVDKEHEDLLIVSYTKAEHNKYDEHAKLYNMRSNKSQNVSSKIGIDITGVQGTAVYEVKGDKRKADLAFLLGIQWYNDAFGQ